MSKYATRLRLSMEDAEEEFLDTTGEEAPEVEAVVSEELDTETVEATEEAAAEADEAESTVNEGAEKVEELEEAAAGLESIHDLLASAIEKGKIHRDTVTFANIAIESYASRVGYGDELNMSTESFQPRLALEGIKEWVTKAWEAIKKFIKKLWSDIKIFFKSLFNLRKKLELRATRLKNAKATGKAKNDKIEAAGLVRMISINGKLQAPGSGKVHELLEGVKTIIGENSADLKTLHSDWAASNNKKFKKDSDKKYNSFGLVNRFGDNSSFIGNPSFRVVGVTIPYVGQLGVTVTTAGKNYASDDKSIDTFSIGMINEIGGMVLKELKVVDDVNKIADDFDRDCQANISRMEKDTPDSADAKAAMSSYARALRTISLNSAKGASRLTGHAMKVMLAYVKLAEKSLAQYNDKTDYSKN